MYYQYGMYGVSIYLSVRLSGCMCLVCMSGLVGDWSGLQCFWGLVLCNNELYYVCLSLCLSVRLSACVYVCLSVCLSVCLYVSVCMSGLVGDWSGLQCFWSGVV